MGKRSKRRGLAHLESLDADGKAETFQAAVVVQILARAKQLAGDFTEASRLHDKAVTLVERLKGPSDSLTGYALHHQTTSWANAGQAVRGEAAQTRAVSILEGLPHVPPLELALALSTMAQITKAAGSYDQAYASGRRALDIQTRQLGDDHASTGETVKLLAEIEQGRGHVAEAQAHYAKATTIDENLRARASRRLMNPPKALEDVKVEFPQAARRFGYEGRGGGCRTAPTTAN